MVKIRKVGDKIDHNITNGVINTLEVFIYCSLLAVCSGLWIHAFILHGHISYRDDLISRIERVLQQQVGIDDDEANLGYLTTDSGEKDDSPHTIQKRDASTCATKAYLRGIATQLQNMHVMSHLMVDLRNSTAYIGYWNTQAALRWKPDDILPAQNRVPNTMFDLQGEGLRVREDGLYFLYLHITYNGRHIPSGSPNISSFCAFNVEKSVQSGVTANTVTRTTSAIMWAFTTQPLGEIIDGSFSGALHRLKRGDVLYIKPHVSSQYCRVNWHRDKTYFGGYRIRT